MAWRWGKASKPMTQINKKDQLKGPKNSLHPNLSLPPRSASFWVPPLCFLLTPMRKFGNLLQQILRSDPYTSQHGNNVSVRKVGKDSDGLGRVVVRLRLQRKSVSIISPDTHKKYLYHSLVSKVRKLRLNKG